MNPFQLQVAFFEQWFGMANALTTATVQAWTTMGQQAMTTWTTAVKKAADQTGSFGASAAGFSWPPAMPFGTQGFGFGPFGVAANPFQPAAMGFPAWASFFMPQGFAALPGLFAAQQPAWPFAPWLSQSNGPSSWMPGSPMPADWMQMPWMAAFAPPHNAFDMTSFLRVPPAPSWPQSSAQDWETSTRAVAEAGAAGAELIEQVASTYRSASGYAVAAIVGPLGVALDPRTFGEPWWNTPDAQSPKKLI